jgi:predicted nuclease of predicted toxin-antitoxin system
MTMDKDFGELIYNYGLPHAGVLLLRLDNANSSEKLFVVENILKYYSEKISNKFCVFQNGRLRIKEK